MLVDGKEFRSVWMEDGKVKMINQFLLPHRFEIVECQSFNDVAENIKNMIIRGAPAIGIAGGYGMALAALSAPEDRFDSFMENAAMILKSIRPTGRDLFYAVERVLQESKLHNSVKEKRRNVLETAKAIADEIIEACRKIGENGSELIKDGFRVLTHCNAGWLACGNWGTATAPIYFAKRQGKKVFVYSDETRPTCQGIRLTSWELVNEGIPHAVIVDNAAGFFMQKGEIDMVITGGDRITLNGDVANQIGTYEKAVLAKENGIPFYIAAPFSSFDLSCKTGKDIPIEERSEEEIFYMFGLMDDGKFGRVRIAPKGSQTKNPKFDVTSAKYITGIITDRGIVKPDGVESLFK